MTTKLYPNKRKLISFSKIKESIVQKNSAMNKLAIERASKEAVYRKKYDEQQYENKIRAKVKKEYPNRNKRINRIKDAFRF